LRLLPCTPPPAWPSSPRFLSSWQKDGGRSTRHGEPWVTPFFLSKAREGEWRPLIEERSDAQIHSGTGTSAPSSTWSSRKAMDGWGRNPSPTPTHG
uniref:Uncharacterized protein n=1 Tax=Aegilops tauschii subsp. strangulata TaxID=200361 RepID=A0A453RC09_AEGTS